MYLDYFVLFSIFLATASATLQLDPIEP